MRKRWRGGGGYQGFKFYVVSKNCLMLLVSVDLLSCLYLQRPRGWGGGRQGNSIGRTRATPGKEVLGSIPVVAARSLLVGSVSV